MELGDQWISCASKFNINVISKFNAWKICIHYIFMCNFKTWFCFSFDWLRENALALVWNIWSEIFFFFSTQFPIGISMKFFWKKREIKIVKYFNLHLLCYLLAYSRCYCNRFKSVKPFLLFFCCSFFLQIKTRKINEIVWWKCSRFFFFLFQQKK